MISVRRDHTSNNKVFAVCYGKLLKQLGIAHLKKNKVEVITLLSFRNG